MLGFLLSEAMEGGISQTVGTTASSRQTSNLNSAEFQIVDDKLEALRLACASMWSLLKDKYGFNDEELVNRIVELDAADGKADGRLTASESCPSCGRKILMRARKICVWCGASARVEGPF